MFQCFSKSKTRIYDDIIDSVIVCLLYFFGKIVQDLLDNICVLGFFLHVFWRPQYVHQYIGCTMSPNGFHHFRVKLSPRNIIDQCRPSVETSLCYIRAEGVNGKILFGESFNQFFQNRIKSVFLFLLADFFRTRFCATSPQVNKESAFTNHFFGLCQGSIHSVEFPTVIERIWGQIQYPHDFGLSEVN